MTKKDAVHALGVTADLLELLDENAFRVAAYRRAERNLDRFDGDWDAEMNFGLGLRHTNATFSGAR